MRVKIGDRWYHPDSDMICIELTEADKKNIRDMGDQTKYCCYPNRFSKNKASMRKVYEFMEEKMP